LGQTTSEAMPKNDSTRREDPPERHRHTPGGPYRRLENPILPSVGPLGHHCGPKEQRSVSLRLF
ncbi:hypothetical protein, partial [Ferrimicrobium sp.]